jgi:hypothetical protein
MQRLVTLTRTVLFQSVTCNVVNYVLNKAAANLTIQDAVASITQGVTPDQVTNIQVDYASKHVRAHVHVMAHPLRGDAHSDAEGVNASVLLYKVTSVDPDITFDALKEQIQDATNSGLLTERLRLFAEEHNVPVLSNVTVGAATVTRQNDPPSDSKSNRLSDGAIAGIVVGAFIAAVLIILALLALCMRKKDTANDSLHQPTNTQRYLANRG